MRFGITIGIVFCSMAGLKAQEPKRQVNVTSAFKPTLKEAAKINFGATPPSSDTARPRLQYQIPNQNLVFAFQPGSLKPLALAVDTGGQWDTWNYAKAGYGSLRTPYLETGLSIGNGQTAGLNLYGQHISSKGKIRHQDFSNTKVDLNGFTRAGGNLEVSGRLGFENENYKRYGFLPRTLEFPEDSLKVQYSTLRSRLALRNVDRNEYGISYAPEIRLDLFDAYRGGRESNAYFNAPLRKTLGEKFEAQLAVEGGMSQYRTDAKKLFKANYLSLAPAVFVATPGLNLQAGVKPTWDRGAFVFLPNVMGELSSSDKKLTLMAGWIGRVRINSFQSLAGTNPWILAPDTLTTSRVEEVYAGLKGSAGDHLSYMVKAGVNKFTNQPLFLNDTGSGKSFQVLYEPDMKAFNIHGEVGYTVGEKFSLRSGLTLNQFSGLEVNKRAWGLLPLEFNTNIRLQVLRDLYVKTDLYAFSSPRYRTKAAGTGRLPGALDWSAGLEFAVVKNVKLWAQFNNMLNNPYERWKQYPTYGFNFLGGVVFSLAQNKN